MIIGGVPIPPPYPPPGLADDPRWRWIDDRVTRLEQRIDTPAPAVMKANEWQTKTSSPPPCPCCGGTAGVQAFGSHGECSLCARFQWHDRCGHCWDHCRCARQTAKPNQWDAPLPRLPSAAVVMRARMRVLIQTERTRWPGGGEAWDALTRLLEAVEDMDIST